MTRGASQTARVQASADDAGDRPRTVREAAFDVLRETGLTTIFANPGSTEVPLLAGLPGDIRFVLALHESSVVGMATGLALAQRAPALSLLHTTAGLGNAVGALATARENRAPLVVVVGQQDRRHLALSPYLAGRLDGLAGDYPVWVDQPVRPADVPGALARAAHEASTHRGPALVIVPMDDWLADAEPSGEPRGAAERVVRARGSDPAAASVLAQFLAGARSPAIVAGSGIDRDDSWAAVVALAERLACPVWQDAFHAQAGFPHDHSQFAGHLPAERSGLRAALAPYDAVLVVGTLAFREYPYRAGGLVNPGTRVAVLTEDPDEAHGSAAELAVLAPLGPTCDELTDRVQPARQPAQVTSREPAGPPAPPDDGEPLRAAHAIAALAERLPPDAVIVNEVPSNRRELADRLPACAPLSFLSAANGSLGFAMPAAAGVRMALPDRAVVAVVGDGSSMYSIHALWSAVRYRLGVVFVVLNNGGYAIMDHLASQLQGAAPWPPLDGIDIAAIARGFGCSARRISTHEELIHAMDEELADVAGRSEPVLLDVIVRADDSVRT